MRTGCCLLQRRHKPQKYGQGKTSANMSEQRPVIENNRHVDEVESQSNATLSYKDAREQQKEKLKRKEEKQGSNFCIEHAICGVIRRSVYGRTSSGPFAFSFRAHTREEERPRTLTQHPCPPFITTYIHNTTTRTPVASTSQNPNFLYISRLTSPHQRPPLPLRSLRLPPSSSDNTPNQHPRYWPARPRCLPPCCSPHSRARNTPRWRRWPSSWPRRDGAH